METAHIGGLTVPRLVAAAGQEHFPGGGESTARRHLS